MAPRSRQSLELAGSVAAALTVATLVLVARGLYWHARPTQTYAFVAGQFRSLHAGGRFIAIVLVVLVLCFACPCNRLAAASRMTLATVGFVGVVTLAAAGGCLPAPGRSTRSRRRDTRRSGASPRARSRKVPMTPGRLTGSRRIAMRAERRRLEPRRLLRAFGIRCPRAARRRRRSFRRRRPSPRRRLRSDRRPSRRSEGRFARLPMPCRRRPRRPHRLSRHRASRQLTGPATC